MEWNQEFGKSAVERMLNRASCRSFQAAHIAEDVLEQILEAGIRAASGGNLQPYSVIVVRDAAKREELAELCGGQYFMGKAPVNLIFLLDWYKLSRLAALQKAPFMAHRSFMHFLIGLEDVMCAAQSIETAAWQRGVGSVYIGTVNAAGSELKKIYNLPKYTYPVLILSLGYPKNELPLRERLPYDMTVFPESYPDFSDEDILRGFEAKYGARTRPLPTIESQRIEWLKNLRAALETTYSETETEAILQEIEGRGSVQFLQYVFGVHYNAKEVRDEGKRVLEMMRELELEPFDVLINNKAGE